MGQFSDDGQWWWNGTTWTPTSQVVIPQLPMTEFERSGQLGAARARRARDRRHFWAWLIPLSYFGLMPGGFANDTFAAYRSWTLEQLALATAYLVGPGERMVAGEMSSYQIWDSWTRVRGLVVTDAHVLVFRIDGLDGQPRTIEFIARPAHVKIEQRRGMRGFFAPGLDITAGNRHLVIHGNLGIFKPQAVLDAWRKANVAASPNL